MPRNIRTAITDSQGNNKTGTHLSTNIIVLVNGNTVGAIQKMTINEARGGIKMIDELGTDGHIDSAPNQSTNVSGDCDRMRFDRMRIAEAFSRGFIHVKSQRIPFDIEIHDRFHDADEENSIITVIKNVWIESIGYTYQTSDFTIMDSMRWQAEDIYSVLNSGNVVGQTLADGTGAVNINSFERAADKGDYRGALDAPGLLNAFLTG